MSYQLNRFHLLLCVFAGFVLAGGFVWLIFFGHPFPLFNMAMWVSAAIIIFYVIGWFARSVLVDDVFAEEEEEIDFELPAEEEPIFEPAPTPLEAEPEIEMPQNIMYDSPAPPDDFEFDEDANDPFLHPELFDKEEEL